MSKLNYEITKARYAKNSIAVKCPSINAFSSREARITQAIGGRWSNREKSYILPATKESRLRQLVTDGYDGIIRFTERRDGRSVMKVFLLPPVTTNQTKDAGVRE